MASQDISRFKNKMGFRYLRGLFYETRVLDETAIYTLKSYDLTVAGTVYPSLYRLYMAANDPTEYTFAVSHLEGWQHWQELSQCTWFQEYRDAWRLELETKLKSESLAKVMLAAKGSTRDAFQANKYLVEKGWLDKATKGRPNKEAIRKEAVRLATENEQINKDAERLLVN